MTSQVRNLRYRSIVFRRGQYLHVGRVQGISGFLLGVVF